MMKFLGDTGASLARKAWYRKQANALAVPRVDDGKPRLLVDVSLIAKFDARTGIQRVVRGVWSTLLKRRNVFELVPVVASRLRGYTPIPYDADGTFGEPGEDDLPAQARIGDVFLGLDLSAHLLPIHAAQIISWKKSGAVISVVCDDLLPLTHPQFFTRRTIVHFGKWLDWSIRTADKIICISADVAEQVARRSAQLQVKPRPALYKVPLGGDLLTSVPSLGIRPSNLALLESIARRPTILMVGTVEPRKGYSVALSAFEKLWSDGVDIQLVIAGKAGWKARSVLSRLEQHPYKGTRLHWVDDATDELLELLYQKCDGLLITSHAEGYCLPMIEAAKHGLPTLARDIPVLREHCYSNQRFYFLDDGAAGLSTAIRSFIDNISKDRSPATVPSWSQCSDALICALGLNLAENRSHGSAELTS